MRRMSLVRGTAVVTPVLLMALATSAQAQATGVSRGAVPARSGQAALSPAQARSLSRDVTDKVIVVLKNQVTDVPDTAGNSVKRAAEVRTVQRGVLSELAETHARLVKTLSLIDAVTATVSPGEAKRLAANPAVARVVPDVPVPVAGGPHAAHPSAPAAGVTPLPGACAPKGKVQLDPEAIENIHAATASGTGPSAQALGYTGAGVTVGFIADGLDPDNPDFIRANGQHVFVDYQDFSGTGTDAPTNGGEAFLDSSSIAAQGRHVYNVASYGAGLNAPCKIRILGVAPGASLVGLNVFGSSNFAYDSVFLEAIDYAVTHDHVNVLNESFGDNPFPDSASLDLTDMADAAAVKAGVTVTVSSGDAGPTSTIGSPATDPLFVSAGATTTYRAYAQTGIGGITAPGVTGWLDNNISGLSSGGFSQTGDTVDEVAPGDLNWTLCTPTPKLYSTCTNFAGKAASVNLEGGTSEAAPLTAGVAALVIQAYRQAHGGVTPSPAVVKQIIVSTSENIDAPADQQGAGMIDAYQAVLAAKSYQGATAAPAGHAVLVSPTQLNAAGQPGTHGNFHETLTNDGASNVTLGLSSRTLGAYHAVSTQTLPLTSANSYATTVTFTVPPGQARLDASVAVPATVNLSLIAPDGDLAEYNLPQGQGNYGNAQVADPAPGTWTALVSLSPGIGSPTSFSAAFQASTAAWVSFGHLSASSITLAPGASRGVSLSASTPAQPGDEAASILVHSSAPGPGFAAVTSIPITLRSLIPAPHPSVTVTGTLTGGNGRAVDTGQTAYYQVRIPSGRNALNADVSTGNASNTFFATLISPDGVAASAAANDLTATPGGALTPETGAQLHVLAPQAGLWTIAVDFYNTVSGTAVSQPFTITLNDTPVTASETGLPTSASTQLAAGTPVSVDLKVTNGGATPEAYFTDARLASSVNVALAPQTVSSLTLPNLTGVVPTYVVPSHTTALTASASSTASLYFDTSWAFGDPDVISTTGKTASASFKAAEVPDGNWNLTPFLTGPTGAKAAAKHTAAVSMTATMAAFDSSVISPTGDLWLTSLNTTAAFTPSVASPGATITIPVTITPEGKAGTKVSGTLYLADSSYVSSQMSFDSTTSNLPEGSDVAAFHYSYTIK